MGQVIYYYDVLKKLEKERENAVHEKSPELAEMFLYETERAYQKLWSWAGSDPNCIDEIQREIDHMNELMSSYGNRFSK